MEDELDLRFGEARSSLDQDLEAFKAFYLRLATKKRQRLKKTVADLTALGKAVSGIPTPRFRIEFFTPDLNDESQHKTAHLTPTLLKMAMAKWDKGEAFCDPSWRRTMRDAANPTCPKCRQPALVRQRPLYEGAEDYYRCGQCNHLCFEHELIERSFHVMGGLAGGVAAAAKLTPEERRERARHAALARWGRRRDKHGAPAPTPASDSK